MLNQVHELYKTITLCLIDHQWTISTMESATSGLIASLLTDTEGASVVFPGASITYSNEQKIANGVSPSIIDTYGVYSFETAKAMACAAKEKYGTRIGVSVTGTFGNPDPANQDSIPGVVYFAIAIHDEIVTKKLSILPQAERFLDKLAVAYQVGLELQKLLETK